MCVCTHDVCSGQVTGSLPPQFVPVIVHIAWFGRVVLGVILYASCLEELVGKFLGGFHSFDFMI